MREFEPILAANIFNAARTPKVTAALEIIGVLVDGAADSTLNYPLVVGNAADVAAAVSQLNSIPGKASAANLTVRTTHKLSPGQSTACQLATDSAGLEANCGVQTYFTAF
ncbi:MAG: hypothetical protein IIA14_00335 [SAR324 cluster bacterium]|nr:hypothetical protein [SAR324 cluster bacterium]